MATYINKRVPGFVNPVTKTFPRMTLAFCMDGTAIMVGALLGIPPLTVVVESATGACRLSACVRACVRCSDVSHRGRGWSG